MQRAFVKQTGRLRLCLLWFPLTHRCLLFLLFFSVPFFFYFLFVIYYSLLNRVLFSLLPPIIIIIAFGLVVLLPEAAPLISVVYKLHDGVGWSRQTPIGWSVN